MSYNITLAFWGLVLFVVCFFSALDFFLEKRARWYHLPGIMLVASVADVFIYILIVWPIMEWLK